ncbi:hypothetical protein [Burkholderia cepacia]|nr:hypothetical protein [Burkholderia cepacia]
MILGVGGVTHGLVEVDALKRAPEIIFIYWGGVIVFDLIAVYFRL